MLAERALDAIWASASWFSAPSRSFDRLFEQAWCLMALAFEPPDERRDERYGEAFAVQKPDCLADIPGNPLDLHHAGPALGEFLLFAVAWRKRLEFLDGERR